MSKEFPFEIKKLDSREEEEFNSHYTFVGSNNDKEEFVRVGPKGYFFPARYESQAANIYNMPLRPSDVFVLTYPRSGTTLIQELVWLITNNLDYDTAKAARLADRYVFLGQSIIWRKIEQLSVNEGYTEFIEDLIRPCTEVLAATASPRYVVTHFPLSLLPPPLLDTVKVVYVVRDPRDVAVSLYHFTKCNNMMRFTSDFKVFFDLFVRDLRTWSPYFEHVKEVWDKRDHPNVLFLFYDELHKDMLGTARRVAEFFGKSYSEQQLSQLTQHMHFDSFKHNPAVNNSKWTELGVFSDDMEFVRKGKSGGWREHFDAELAARAQAWVADNLRATDMRFPGHGD